MCKLSYIFFILLFFTITLGGIGGLMLIGYSIILNT